MKKYGALFIVVLIASAIACDEFVRFVKRTYNTDVSFHVEQKELRYYREACFLNDFLYREGTSVRVEVIKDTLTAIDKYLPRYFPNGPFAREDFIALALVESNFNQFEVGTSGEKGIFQIMPDEFKNFKVRLNQYDIATNTEMCMEVLKGKYDRFPDYKKAIIAYNGVVRRKNGKWSDKYWKAFMKRRVVAADVGNVK